MIITIDINNMYNHSVFLHYYNVYYLQTRIIIINISHKPTIWEHFHKTSHHKLEISLNVMNTPRWYLATVIANDWCALRLQYAHIGLVFLESIGIS